MTTAHFKEDGSEQSLLFIVCLLCPSQLCEIGERTVWAATKAYEGGGWAAVTVRHAHRSKCTGSALTAEQKRKVQRLIRDHVPDQLKTNCALSTRQSFSQTPSSPGFLQPLSGVNYSFHSTTTRFPYSRLNFFLSFSQLSLLLAGT
jgi:hypothetical protein